MSMKPNSEDSQVEGFAYRGWLVVLGCVFALATSSGAVVAFTLSIFIGPIAKTFQWSNTAVALGLSVLTFSLALTAPFAGRLFDKFGIRRTLFIVIPLFSLCLALLGALPNSYPLYLGLMGMAGVLGAFHSSIPYVKAVSEWFDWRRGLALGLTMSGVALGGIILTQVASRTMRAFDWRAGFVAMGATILVIGMLAVLLLVRERGSGPDKADLTTDVLSGLSVGEAIRDLRFWGILVFVLCLNMTVNGIAASGAAILEWKGLAGNEIATAVSLMALASLLGRLLIGIALDHVHAPRVAAWLGVTSLTALCLLAFGQSHVEVMAAMALIGFALGAETDVIGFMISRYCGLRNFGTLFGIMLGVFSLAPALGIPALSLSLDYAGSYKPAMIGFAVAVLASTFLIQFLGPYRFKRQALT